MARRPALLITAIPTALALVLSGVMTRRDWQLNPGGVFRSGQGTHWGIVVETFSSWFLPTGLLFVALAHLGALGARLLRNHHRS